MLAGVRARLQREYARQGSESRRSCGTSRGCSIPSSPNVLTLGFARRFATYKRASLLLRIARVSPGLLKHEERPVLFLFAGKAHPADQPGQQVLREIKQLMLSPGVRRPRRVSRGLRPAAGALAGHRASTCGSTIPVAPLEASGTSGIKAAINGRLNVSILDGWWAEGFDQDNGWGIPAADVQDTERRDATRCGRDARCARGGGGAAVLRAQRRGLLARMGAALQARDDDRDPALQHGPCGAGLCARACTTRPPSTTSA